MLINVKSQSITVIDPFGIEDARLEKYFNSWCTYYKSRKDCQSLNWSKQRVIHPLQVDSYNCGPWCCVFLVELITKGSIDLNSSFVIDKYRLEMCNNISNYA